MNTCKWLMLPVAALWCLTALTGFSAPTAGADPAPLAAGYSEQYTFRIAGKSIGTQSATLLNVNNGRQTWKFSVDLLLPDNNGQTSIKQGGTFVLSKDGFPVRLDMTALVKGSSRNESLLFGPNGVMTAINPAITSLPNPIPVTGHPYLWIDDIITLVSLETRANFAKQSAKYVLPEFSGGSFQPLSLTLQPSADRQISGADSKVFDATISGPGISGSVLQFWLSNTTGAVIRIHDKVQNLEIARD